MYYTFKLLLFGDGGVGKTSLVEMYVNGTFKEDSQMKIGVQFLVKRLKMDEDNVNLQIWDFGGEERFRFLLPAYCRGARGGIFIYDVTSPGSLYSLDKWLRVIRQWSSAFPVIMVGTKLDLRPHRKVMKEEVTTVASEYNIPEVIEVSSKSGQNVGLVFETISKLMLRGTVQNTVVGMIAQNPM